MYYDNYKIMIMLRQDTCFLSPTLSGLVWALVLVSLACGSSPDSPVNMSCRHPSFQWYKSPPRASSSGLGLTKKRKKRLWLGQQKLGSIRQRWKLLMPSFGWGFNGRNRIGIDGFVVHRSGTGSPSSSTRATSQIQALQISTPHDSHPPFF